MKNSSYFKFLQNITFLRSERRHYLFVHHIKRTDIEIDLKMVALLSSSMQCVWKLTGTAEWEQTDADVDQCDIECSKLLKH